MKYIKITCGWATSEQITKRLLSQFKTPEIDLTNISFVHDHTYDLLVVMGYFTEDLRDGGSCVVFPQEPTWTGNHQKSFSKPQCGRTNEDICVLGFDTHYYTPQDIVTETIAHMFYGGVGPVSEGYDFWNYDYLINEIFNKTKGFCSFVSQLGLDNRPYESGCLYSDRINLISNIHSQAPYMDFYGWGNKDNLKPGVAQKGPVIKDYQFSLAIENSYEKNYLSEKFYDCILTNTIPIYYGCPNIKDYWPEEGYILLDNIKDHSRVADKLYQIYENQEEIYNRMLPELLRIKTRYFKEFNLLKKILTYVQT